MWRTFMVDGGGGGSGPSSDFGEVNVGGSLYPQHSLASVYLSQLGIECCLLVVKFIVALSYLPRVCACFSSW
jgi:hypothetical protein